MKWRILAEGGERVKRLAGKNSKGRSIGLLGGCHDSETHCAHEAHLVDLLARVNFNFISAWLPAPSGG
jgi:hypothetical protein